MGILVRVIVIAVIMRMRVAVIMPVRMTDHAHDDAHHEHDDARHENDRGHGPHANGPRRHARAPPRSPRARRSADWSSWSPALGSRSSCTLCSLFDFDAFDVQLFAAQALKLARAAWTRREHVGRGKFRAADVAARLRRRLRECPASRPRPACRGRLPENRRRRPPARRPTICRSRSSRGARYALARPATPIRRCCKRSRVRARRLL